MAAIEGSPLQNKGYLVAEGTMVVESVCPVALIPHRKAGANFSVP